MSIENTLQERGDRYGSFEHHAEIAQRLQDVMRLEDGWQALAADQKQALTVIADKIARMLNGDPTYRDNWHDIVGYAKLVDDRMLRDELRPAPAKFVPIGWTQYFHGAPGPSVGAVVDVLYDDDSTPVAENKIVGQFSWEGVRAYRVRLVFETPKMPPVPSESQATHREPGGARMKRCELTGRWLMWGNKTWFYASADENYEPTDLIAL